VELDNSFGEAKFEKKKVFYVVLGKILASSVARPSPSKRPIGSTRSGQSSSREINLSKPAKIIRTQPVHPTRVPIDTYARVDLGITRDLGDVGREAKLDRVPGASPVTSPIKDRAPGISDRGPEIPVRPKPRLPRLLIPVYIGNRLTVPQTL
jgi:hypothetical protein